MDYLVLYKTPALRSHSISPDAWPSKEAALLHGQLERKMTPDELAEAQRLAREWKVKGE